VYGGGSGGSGKGGSTTSTASGPVQSLSSIAAEAVAAARARFFPGASAAATLVQVDGWCVGAGAGGGPAGVRELDNASLCAGRSLTALAHPLFPLALVAPRDEAGEEDEEDD
jgi:hypothetical protein